MEMTNDDLKKECQYCYREIDNSGLEGFRCTNRTAIKARDSSWCYPKNANEPCSICDYCKPKEELKMSIDLAMNNLSRILTEATEDEDSVCYVTEDDAEKLQVAIETMKKYQNIEDVMKNYRSNPIDCLFRIRRILER